MAGLFRGVIASSGSALVPWALAPDGLRTARGLAKELGLQAETAEEIAEALRSVRASDLNEAAFGMAPISNGVGDELMFLPVIEPAHPGAFISEDPYALVRDGKSSPMPLMTGVCSAEGLVWGMFTDPTDEETYKKINGQKYFFLPPDLRQALTDEECDKCVQEILEAYTGGKPFSKDTVAQFVELHGDTMFLNKAVVLCHLHAAANTSPIYLYRFDFVGRLNFFKSIGARVFGKNVSKIPGTAHGDELPYLSNACMYPVPSTSRQSREMLCRNRILELWSNFIKTGEPTPEGTDTRLVPVLWRPCSRESMPYLNIDDDLELRTDKLFTKQVFWEELYQKYLGKPMWDAS